MQQEQRTISFDNELQIEAYQFIGLMQKFPNHFHEYYVIGYVESGRRALTCKNKEYIINSGDLVIFNPLENHACAQVDERALDWRCFHIKTEIMKKTAAEITGSSRPPHFSVNVIPGSDIVPRMKELHQMIQEGRTDFERPVF